MATTVNIHEAKTHLSKLLEQVAAGERVVIAKAGKPIADLVPHHRIEVVFGGLKGQISYHEEAFANPDSDVIEMFYGADASA